MDGNKGKKKWDNCNSIINKIYLKKKKVGIAQKEVVSPLHIVLCDSEVLHTE